MAGEQLLYNRPLPGARLNMAHPLSKGLVGCWLLNENGGIRAMDLSPYENHGLLVDITGGQRPFNGLLFDGTNDTITVPDSTSLKTAFGSKVATLEAFVYVMRDTDYESIIAKKDSGVFADHPLAIFKRVTGLQFQMGDGVNQRQMIYSVPLDSWYHVAGVADGADLFFYIDGLQKETISINSTPTTSTDIMRIGSSNGTWFFQGRIAVARVWNRALTAQDIKELYINPYKPGGLALFL